LTVAEAAAIQPTYCYEASGCICGGSFEPVSYPVPATGALVVRVVREEESGRAVARVDAVHGDVGAFAVDDTVQLANSGGPGTFGTRMIVPVDANETVRDGGPSGPRVYGIGPIPADDRYHCARVGHPDALSTDQIIAAVTSADCVATLASYDREWTTRMGEECPGGPSSSSCATTAGAPSTLGILLALVGALVARRARRQAGSR
jgi:uncharacterized protein (TIGR03382 family)